MQKFHRHTKQVPRTPVPGARCVVVLIMQHTLFVLAAAVDRRWRVLSSIRLFKFGKVATNMRSRPTKGKQLLSKEASVGAQAGKHWLVGWVGR